MSNDFISASSLGLTVSGSRSVLDELRDGFNDEDWGSLDAPVFLAAGCCHVSQYGAMEYIVFRDGMV